MEDRVSDLSLCPECGSQLTVWYALGRQEMVCGCEDYDCPLVHEGTGDTRDQALSDFHGIALLKHKPKQKEKLK
jgi:hypothetical protein